MLFNSWSFLVFALLVYSIHSLIPSRRKNLFLLGASYFFYSCWDYRFLSLILLSTFIDYFCALHIARSSSQLRQRVWLTLSCFFNLGMLGVFKYLGFFVDSLNSLFSDFGFEAEGLRLDVILPVGISFYTFQTMSYTIDVYRQRLAPITDYLTYSLYVAFFPQLVAGPIERASHLLPQLVRQRSVSDRQFYEGVWLVSWGLFKKIVMADTLAMYVNRAYDPLNQPDTLLVLLGTYSFAYQIYFDFSGYSDIARGLSKFLGIDLIRNFNQPYLSKSPQEFWRRWHISLSTWFRDYVHIPLGGNRRGTIVLCRNLLITMTIAGLWHGANATFLLWGVYHGVLLGMGVMLSRFTPGEKSPSFFRDGLRVIGTFHLVCFGWIFFRCDDFSSIQRMLSGLFHWTPPNAANTGVAAELILFITFTWIVEFTRNEVYHGEASEHPRFQVMILLVPVLWLAILIGTPVFSEEFIYFQF